MKEQEGHMKSLERKMKSFEKELSEQLVKDGYLGNGDKINSINWEKDGSIRINGRKIKETHQQKYTDLHNKYFKEGARFGLVE
jgi:predicted phage-related endonuclease